MKEICQHLYWLWYCGSGKSNLLAQAPSTGSATKEHRVLLGRRNGFLFYTYLRDRTTDTLLSISTELLQWKTNLLVCSRVAKLKTKEMQNENQPRVDLAEMLGSDFGCPVWEMSSGQVINTLENTGPFVVSHAGHAQSLSLWKTLACNSFHVGHILGLDCLAMSLEAVRGRVCLWCLSKAGQSAGPH